MKVTVYTTPTCPWCTRVKDYLKFKNMQFEEVNVAKDREKAIEMVEKSKQMGVPVVDIDGNIIVGFNQGAIDNLIR